MFAHALQEVHNVVIVANAHAALLKVLAHLVGNLVLVDEQFPVVARDVGKGNDNRGKCHVVAAQVEQPCDVV